MSRIEAQKRLQPFFIKDINKLYFDFFSNIGQRTEHNNSKSYVGCKIQYYNSDTTGIEEGTKCQIQDLSVSTFARYILMLKYNRGPSRNGWRNGRSRDGN